jgi:hypothetical protein
MEYIQNYIQPHIVLVAIFTNIVIDILKPYLSKLPFANEDIYVVFAFIFSFVVMLILSTQIDMMITFIVDGMVSASLTVLFYHTKLYPWIRDKFVEKRSAL